MQGSLRAAGFLIWQRGYATPETLNFVLVQEQLRLTTIGVLTDLSFSNLRNSDTMIFAAEKCHLQRITTPAKIPTVMSRVRKVATMGHTKWAKIASQEMQSAVPSSINGPLDIMTRDVFLSLAKTAYFLSKGRPVSRHLG